MNQPQIVLTLKPSAQLDRISVTTVLSNVSATPDKPFLQTPIVIASVRTVVYGDGDVVASDAAGPLPLTITEDLSDTSGFGQFRLFTAGRTSEGDITLQYSAPITPALSPRRPGPSYDLRGHDGGFAGAGFGFLILPKDDERVYQIALNWDLRELAEGARGVSTLGDGNVITTGLVERLYSTFLVAGALHCAPENAGSLAFNAFWLGTPNFDAPATMAWTVRSFDVLREFFDERDLPPYYLIGRAHPNPRDGGAATVNGFMIEYGPVERPDAALRFMFTHEMFHHFVGVLDGPYGTSSWFGEGLAEFYKVRLPLRAGLLNAAEAEAEIRSMTDSYYENPRNRLPNDAIAAEYWKDSLVQNLAYHRGMIYFADVDAKVRAASGQQRSLDDLLLAMLDSRRNGTGYDEAAWRRVLRAELGDSGIQDFEAMLAGELIAPPSDAFGADFERTTVDVVQFQLGFSDRCLLDTPRVIKGLIPASAAAKAGLREGDVVVRNDDAEQARKNMAPVFHLDVRRGDEVIPIHFSTQGELVGKYVWTRR
ncbi:hypothetical protein JOF56_009618 [Kibdelosporangium banguiense]|uniref:Peptidase M61 catalytic domain-containing protein n=1 Tax=Kibdelosporangium banguiense TaxID=1365924 RepID=A0ABS4TXX8_9PSEU|nr:hypothetical protein [Kibdelosporangium banguiense]MBP2329233.1 hypothetical protein [Kibdelosporangium banguiense]